MDFLYKPTTLIALFLMAIAVILIPRLSKEEDQPNAVDTMSEMGIMSSPLTDDNVDEQERQLRLALVSKICDEDAEGFIPHEVCWDGNQDNDQLLGLALADQEIVGVLFFGACSPGTNTTSPTSEQLPTFAPIPHSL